MPPGEFRDEDARNSLSALARSLAPVFSVLVVSLVVTHAEIDRARSRIPVRLVRRNQIGGTETTLDANRGCERAPSGQSSCLEVRFKHLASFLGLLVPGQTRVGRH